MTVGEKECGCKSQIYVVTQNEQRDALFIGTELYSLLTAPIQIKRTFRLIAINLQQLSTFAGPLLPGQETL